MMSKEMIAACEEMAEKYATSEKLPTKREWIETNGGEHGQYLSYEVRWFVVDAFCAGFNAAYELMSKEIESMDDKLKGMACEHNDVSLDLIEERAKSQKLVEALEEAAEFDRCDDVNGMAGEICAKALAEYRGEVTKLQVPEIEELNKQLAKDRKNV